MVVEESETRILQELLKGVNQITKHQDGQLEKA